MEFLLGQAWYPQCVLKKYLYFLDGGNIDLKYKVSRREKYERKVLPGTLLMLRNYILISSLMQCAAVNI